MRPLALTMGDPAGIGGELTLGAWRALRAGGPEFVVLDDPDRLRALAASLRLDIDIAEVATADATGFAEALPVLPVRLANPAHPGRPDPANAHAIIAAIEQATELARAGAVGGVVTNPINKSALYQAGFAYPGHTEFLAALTGAPGRQEMMLASPALRVVPVTVHASLRDAIASLTTARILNAARTTAAAPRRAFGLPHPPLGDEETRLIAPAIAALRAEGEDVSGPWPPDTMFTEAARARYDVAICMYHDQGLIPLKTLDMAHGVNVTLGLPIVRTSPDHGTAYDIAGTGAADPASLIAALRLAAAIAARR